MSYDNIDYKSWDIIYKAIGAPSVNDSEEEWDDFLHYPDNRFRFQFTDAQLGDNSVYLNCMFRTRDEGIYDSDVLIMYDEEDEDEEDEDDEEDEENDDKEEHYGKVTFDSYKGNYSSFERDIGMYEHNNLVGYYELRTKRKFPYACYEGTCTTRGGFTGWNWISLED